LQRGDRGGEIKIILGKFAPDRDLVELTFCEEGVTVGAVLAGHRGCLGYGRYDRYSPWPEISDSQRLNWRAHFISIFIIRMDLK